MLAKIHFDGNVLHVSGGVIPAHAFEHSKDIKVVFLDGVTKVDYRAFYGCINLMWVYFSDDTCLTYIGNQTFLNCVSLKIIYLPEGLTFLGQHAFQGCSGITNVHLPDTLLSISDNTFCACSSILAVRLPPSLGSIGTRAFFKCSSLVDIHLPQSLESIGKNAFQSCRRLQLMVFPGSLESIGSNAFWGCSYLSRVIFYKTPDKIDPSAFDWCAGLEEIVARDSRAEVFNDCCGFLSRVIPLSDVPLLRRTFWHPTTHNKWCTLPQRRCVLAVLVAELRLDVIEELAVECAESAGAATVLPSLAHELWLLILVFVPRHALGQ